MSDSTCWVIFEIAMRHEQLMLAFLIFFARGRRYIAAFPLDSKGIAITSSPAVRNKAPLV